MTHADMVTRALDTFGRHTPIVHEGDRQTWLREVVYPQSRETWGHLGARQRLEHLCEAALRGCAPTEPEPFRTWWRAFWETELPELQRKIKGG